MALAQRNFDPIVNAKSQLSNKIGGGARKREKVLWIDFLKLVYPVIEMNIGSILIQLN